MGIDIQTNLKELGLSLPEVAAPAANYVPYLTTGKYLFIAGQIPFLNGQPMHQGRLDEDLNLEDGVEAAKACALNILAQVNASVDGDWSRVKKCIKLGGFVACKPSFTKHPAVINGASDLMVAVLGEAGKHTRFAVGVPSLPFNVCVEIDALFELKLKTGK